MSYNNYSFMSTLDSLVLETTEQPAINTEEAAEELALWTNAKFTYDIAPGQGILDDKQLDMDKKIYDQLAKYLDIDLISQPTSTTTASPSSSSSSTVTTTTTPTTSVNNSPINNISESFKPILSRPPPTILPKPSNNDINHLNTFALPISPLLPTVITSSPSMLINPSIVNNNHTTNITPIITNNNNNNNNNNKKRPLPKDQSSLNPADDDKRRRNTAASARFRVKKKLKEQALTQSVREMTEKADKLQNRVHELENEIKWLRDLLLEKNGKN